MKNNKIIGLIIALALTVSFFMLCMGYVSKGTVGASTLVMGISCFILFLIPIVAIINTIINLRNKQIEAIMEEILTRKRLEAKNEILGINQEFLDFSKKAQESEKDLKKRRAEHVSR